MISFYPKFGKFAIPDEYKLANTSLPKHLPNAHIL